ncbi:hypothetical protein DIS24_g1749 [Lasiodiplodia hormozganensis]|uniref:Uncharacterized protein n=1 Tax=Lasiodiplodia hormozganensis TaxID=869390 RepID=A0AA39Z322_9PEZI|nr:hypothetical protein DIS24_g1749 [Lasiodiplodia hormozganensis]
MQSNQANPESPWTSAYAACELSAKTLVSVADGSAALDLLSKLSFIPFSSVSIEAANSAWRKHAPSNGNELYPPRRERNAVTPPPASTTSFEAAMNRLLSFSFISVASDRISIHPIIRAWAQDRNPHLQHTPPLSRSDSSRSASPYHRHSMYAPTTNLELYPYGTNFEQTHRSGSMPDDRYCLPQPRLDSATAPQQPHHFTTTPPSPRSREPSPFDRRRESAYGPFATGERYATNSDTEEEAPRWRSTTIRRYIYTDALPVRPPSIAREAEYYHEMEYERPDLFTSDEESAGEEEEERYRSSRYLRVEEPPSSRRPSGSRRRGDGEAGREDGRRRRRTRSRHRSRGSHSSDRRSEEESNYRGREARETKLEVRGSVGFGRWKYQAVFAASSGGRTG